MMNLKESALGILMFLLATTSVLVRDVLGTSSSDCQVDFVAPNLDQVVWMCNQSRSLGEGRQTCSNDTEGLVVGEMVTSVLKSWPQCQFTNTDSMNMTCLRNTVGRQKEYDQVFAEILNSVSGQPKVDQVTRIDPLPVTADGGILTPFIAFKKSCKPVAANRIDVVDICTNRSINYTRVYLVLKSEEDVNRMIDPSLVCRCTLQANLNITLQALDVRLQNRNQCGRSSIKFDSEEKSVELKCQDRAAWFGSETLAEGKVINVTLFSGYIPKMVWLEGKAETGTSVLNTISVSCRTEVDYAEKDDFDAGDDDTNSLIIFVIIGLGGVCLIVFIVVLVIFRHRLQNFCKREKMQGVDYHLVSPSSSATSQPLNPAPPDEVYSELEQQEVYSEPQQPASSSPTWSVKHAPPPLPYLPPPPSSPTEGGPPKPKRSVKGSGKEEYDHIDMNCKGVKPEDLELTQNNNLHGDGDGDEDAEGNVYDHINSPGEYSDTGTFRSPKKLIVDNVYAMPDLKGSK